ncbi:MAG TPA: IclR family transcriptional regulator [Acidobacteriaceae bacterium]|nr:IclR family transcriptional regulator [Acidobacteriaceae bacterium]
MNPKSSHKPTRTLDRNLIASLAHGLSVLEAIAAHKGDIPLATLATVVGLKKTSTWRLVHTLAELGYVRQDPKTRNFSPAPRVLSLGYAYFDGLDLKQLSAPFLQELATFCNETVNLAVQDGDELVYIERIRSPQIVNINLHVGSRIPLYNTSMGRALICEKPDSWLDEYMQRIEKDQKAQEYLRDDQPGLRRILSETRRLGYATNDEELTRGLRGVASPIRGASGEIVGAVGISVPSSRATLADLRRKYVPELLATSDKISLTLGHRRKPER